MPRKSLKSTLTQLRPQAAPAKLQNGSAKTDVTTKFVSELQIGDVFRFPGCDAWHTRTGDGYLNSVTQKPRLFYAVDSRVFVRCSYNEI